MHQSADVFDAQSLFLSLSRIAVSSSLQDLSQHSASSGRVMLRVTQSGTKLNLPRSPLMENEDLAASAVILCKICKILLES